MMDIKSRQHALPHGAATRWRAARRRGWRLALVALAVASLGASTALAGGKLDQQNTNDPGMGGFGAGIDTALTDGQTFTAGRSGSLERVAVYLERDFSETLPDGTIFLEVYPTDAAGTPRTNGRAIGSGRLPTAAVAQADGFVDVPLSRPAPVERGTVYAIVLHADTPIGGAVYWDGSVAPDHYPGGGNASRPDANAPWTVFPSQDHYFKTFVSVRRHRHR
jgi:hypothetical protein